MDESEQVGTIQIYSSDEAVAQTIKNFVGKDVFVQGTPFGAHTAHHHAPIVMEITGILAKLRAVAKLLAGTRACRVDRISAAL